MSVLSRLTSLLNGGAAGAAGGYQRISPKEAREKLAAEKDIILLDVRTPQEYRGKRIAGSVLIPLSEIGQQAPKQLPRKDATLIVYCQSGMRSRQAVTQLLAMGYTNVYDLGGIMSWPYETVSG